MAQSSQTGPAFCLAHSPSPRSWTLAYSHKAVHSRFNVIHLHNPCKYMDYYSFTNPRGLSWHSWLTHRGHFNHHRLLVSCSRKAGLDNITYRNVKKTKQFKTVFNSDSVYITQLKQQKSKRCYYFCSTSP